jgi:Iap family predicted aminopeptidase
VLNNWAKSNFTEKTFDVLSNSMDTAESVVAMEELRSMVMGGNTMVPSNTDAVLNNVTTIGDVQQEMMENLAKYKSNPSYRKEISAKIERASASSASMFTDK